MTNLDCPVYREEIMNRFICGTPFSSAAREHYINCVDCIGAVTEQLSKNCARNGETNGKPKSEAAKAAIARGRKVLEREFGIPADL